MNTMKASDFKITIGTGTVTGTTAQMPIILEVDNLANPQQTQAFLNLGQGIAKAAKDLLAGAGLMTDLEDAAMIAIEVKAVQVTK